MTAITAAAPDTPPRASGIDWAAPLAPVVVTILILTSLIRVVVGSDELLWLDETWTGLHASQPSLAAFLRWVYVDINAPLYYALMWVWAHLFGLSDGSLRFPSLLFGLAFPLLALIPTREIDRTTGLVWCALLATWSPGLFQSQEARCYTMLLALCTGGTILHARLMARPTLWRATAWAAVGSLAILTHYYAAILFGCQGLIYLAVRRGAAMRTWPAALAFVPAFGWMAYHLPQLTAFAETNWYSPEPVLVVIPIIGFAIGWTKLLIPAMAIGRSRRKGTEPDAIPHGSAGLRWVVAATVLAAGMLAVAGILRPVFTLRYMTIFAPGLLLGCALWARNIGLARPFAPLVLVAACGVSSIVWAVSTYGFRERFMSLEAASDALMAAKVDLVAFAWDNRSTKGLLPADLASLGGFFFKRAGYPVRVLGVTLDPGDDPNGKLMASAIGPRAGIMWIYDLHIGGTAAATYPPVIDRLDPSWRCHDYGGDRIGVVACVRAPAS